MFINKIKNIIKNHEREIKEIFFVACGGSWVDMYASNYLVQKHSKFLRSQSYTANEFIYSNPRVLGENSIVILCSHSGNTPESLEAAEMAKERGALTISLTHNEEAKIISLTDHNILYHWDEENGEVSFQPLALILMITVEVLNKVESFELYDEFYDGIEKIDEIVFNAKDKVADEAKLFAKQYKDEKLLNIMGSGASFGHVYGFSICSLMEMQRIFSIGTHTGEYFHGPFEVTENGVPYILMINSGDTRTLDLRAKSFLETHTDKLVVIDSEEFGITGIDSKIVDVFNPILFYGVLCVYRKELSIIRGHPLEKRRYMGVVEY